MNFGTYDFETYNWSKPLCIGIHYESDDIAESDFFIDREDPDAVAITALQMMEEASYTHDIKSWWGHNGGKFDVLFIVDVLPNFPGWRFDGVTASGRVISLRVISPRVTFELKDSFAVIQSSLEKALESFEISTRKVFTKEDYEGIQKCLACEEMQANFKPISRHSCMLAHSDKKLKEGCLADCKGAFQLLQKARGMFEEWGGSLKGTFSSSALTVVKAKLGKPLPSHKDHQAENSDARIAYLGGRVENYKHSPKPWLREYDVTSSYPWSMTQLLPWQLIGRGKPDLFSTEQMGVVYATVNVPEQYIPPLPFTPKGGGLFFPFGRWSSWFTTVELAYAIQHCGVTAIFHDAINYTVERPFVGFIEEVFETKSKATGALREFAKLVMNGSYGKFGQKPENTKLKVFPNREEAIKFENSHPGCSLINDEGTALQVTNFRWPKQTHYALASTITAYSRILLHKFLMSSHNAGSMPAYCDTDAVHCMPCHSLDNHVSEKLGDLKVELDQYIGRFYAPKLYHLKLAKEHPKKGLNVYASKGFPVSEEAFTRIVQGERVGNPKGRMQLIKTQLRSGNRVKHLTEAETEKAWSGRSNKRRIIPFTLEGDTAPWHIRELMEGLHCEQQSPIAPAKPNLDRPKRRRG